jgi:4-amino-4-deoxy-L-arabinose transferase-like glycosyltransferase
MEATTPICPQAIYNAVWPARWPGRWTLAVLLLLAFGVRGWLLWSTPIPARDSVMFVKIAERFEETRWQKVLLESYQHPGYPLTIWAVSVPVRHLAGTTDCAGWLLSAQLASALAGWLLVVPMYFMGKHLYSRGVGFWAALLFQVLPVSGLVLSDGLSDSLYLLLAATAILFGMYAITGHNVPPRADPEAPPPDRAGFSWAEIGWFALSGLFTGLAYLVRPEGLLVIAATGLVLVGRQVLSRPRRPWRQFVLSGTCLVTACALAGSPYYLTVGRLTVKPSVHQISKQLQEVSVRTAPGLEQPPVSGALFAMHINRNQPWTMLVLSGLAAVVLEFGKCYYYFGCLPLLLGVWWCRDRYRLVPGTWVALVLIVLQMAVVWCLAVVAGYVSSRHVLIMVICTLPQMVAASIQAPYRLQSVFASWRSRTETAPVPATSWCYSPALWALLLIATMTIAGLPRLLRPMHPNRMGHREAGRWLADHTTATDTVHDVHRWASFYSGRVLGQIDPADPSQPQRQFVIIDRASQRDFSIGDAKLLDEETVRRNGGSIVFSWPEHTPPNKGVVIYQLP